MGAGTSKKDDDTSIRDATTRGPITFDDATLHFVKGGPPPPPSETSTRLQPQWNEAFMRLTQKAREKQASRAMSTKEALDAFKARFGESAFVEAFGSEDKYLKSIVRPVTVSGTSSKLWHLGDREYDIRSEHAQAIQALDAQPTGAAILPAPGGAAGAGGDATRPWDGLELTPSVSPERDASLNHWKAWFDSDETPNQTLWNGGAWPADEEPPEWNDFGAPHGAPPAVRRPQQIASYYRGPRPAGLASKTRMTKALCGNDPTMLALWAHAEFYSQVRARYDAELAASRAMWAKWRAQSGGSGDGRATRGLERRSHDPKDAYAALTRKKTEELIENDLRAWYKRHKGALMGQLAHNEPLLKAIAEDVGVPRCVLTARDVNDRTHLLSPAIKVNFPGLGSQLVTSNYDHVDKGWKDDPSVAIRELGFRRLIWGKLNKKLPGYEWYLAHDAERLYLDAYLESSLCFDSSFGEHWVFEFPIKDEPAWWAKTTKDQQHSELSYIVNHLLKGAILGATEGRADAAWNSST